MIKTKEPDPIRKEWNSLIKGKMKKLTDKALKERIKKILDYPPESTKELHLLDGNIIKSLIMCVYCFTYLSQYWSFCPCCSKKSQKLSRAQREKAIYKTLKKGGRSTYI